MTVEKTIYQYLWILRTIRNAGSISFEDLNQLWLSESESEGVPIANSSFLRHRRTIENVFGVKIGCRSNGLYYIDADEFTPQQWITDTLSVNSVLLKYMGLSPRIQLEPIPCDGDLLRQVISAMQQSVRLRILYQKYTTDEPRTHLIEPYSVKLFRQRWYVLAHTDGMFKMFSLDRIKRLQNTGEPFALPRDFDANAFFSSRFGVFLGDNVEVQRVVVRAFATQVKYMRDLPWHVSQREIATTADYSDFEYHLHPTIDFSNHIMAWGNRVQVLEPQWLAEHIRDRHLEAGGLYV